MKKDRQPTLDLPLGKYYVKELAAPAGFVSSDEILAFDASYQGQDIPVVKLESVKKNEPTTVEITKSDITTGVELSGASLSVIDKGDIRCFQVTKRFAQCIGLSGCQTFHDMRLIFYGYPAVNRISVFIDDR